MSRWVWLGVLLFAGSAAASGVVFGPRPVAVLPIRPVAVIQNRGQPAGSANREPTGNQAVGKVVFPPAPTSTASPTADAESRGSAFDPSADALDGAQARVDGEGLPGATDQDGALGDGTTPMGDVPVLMYHYIRVNPVATDRVGFNLSVTPSDFATQMRYLAEHGYHPLTMAQIREHVLHGTALPPHPIALTFDDGYDDAFTAARPVLERYHFTATFYIITGFVGRPNYLTWSQVGTLDHSGFEIGSHTVHHVGLPFVSPTTRLQELTASRAAIESHLDHAVLDFCYPSGEVDAPTESAVREAGYLSATTTAPGWAGTGSDPLRIPRVRVSGGMALAQFVSLLTRAPRATAASTARRPTPTPRAARAPRPTPAASPTAQR